MELGVEQLHSGSVQRVGSPQPHSSLRKLKSVPGTGQGEIVNSLEVLPKSRPGWPNSAEAMQTVENDSEHTKKHTGAAWDMKRSSEEFGKGPVPVTRQSSALVTGEGSAPATR